MVFQIGDFIKKYYTSQAPNKCIHKYNAFSMSDVYNILEDIEKNVFKNDGDTVGRSLWFRGQKMEKYVLLPSLYRERKNREHKKGVYSSISLAEEYRHQHFSARVSHLMQISPRSRVEWQEVLQHHLGKTRFMDWSESVGTAVDFALEPFIDTKNTENNRINRSAITPGVWVLDAYKLNEHVYDFFADPFNKEYVERALKNLFEQSEIEAVAEEMQKDLAENKDIYFNFGEEEIIDLAINGLVSVCVLDEHYHYNAHQMRALLIHHEFNPFFYFVVRYYADAIPIVAGINKRLLPPIASIQPYHSERIRAQRGTFTIYPNYCRTKEAEVFAGTDMDVVAVESQDMIRDCFCLIRLCDPARIAKDMIYAGERWPEIYPDVQVYADYLETKEFFV